MYELGRMSNYDIDLVQTENEQINLYYAVEKAPPTGARDKRPAERCFFARAVLVRHFGACCLRCVFFL